MTQLQSFLSFVIVTCFSISPLPFFYRFYHTHKTDFSIKTITPPQHMGKELPIGLHVCDYTGIQKFVITCRRVEVVNGLSVVLLTTNLTQVVLSQVPHLINSKAANITHCRRCVNVWGSCGSKVYTCVSKSVL